MMKRQISLPARNLSEDISKPVCPADCSHHCVHQKEMLTAEFKKFTAGKGKILPGTECKRHRMLFVIRGDLLIQDGKHDKQALTGGQCILLSRDSKASVKIMSNTELYTLDFNNRLIFCDHDILKEVAVCGQKLSGGVSVLPISPSIISFFENLELNLSRLDIPCYHLIKEYELGLLMWNAYGAANLGHFFRDILRPHDDFKMFILSSYRQVEGMAEFARMAGMSVSTFKRKFMESFHEPYNVWRIKQKVHDITKAVRDGICSNEELMNLFGFKSYLAFYRFCSRHMYCSPTALREKYKDG